MVRRPRNQKLREGGQFAGDFESVSTDSLDNGVAGKGNTITRLFGEHIESKNPDGDATVEFVNLSDDYPSYVIRGADVSPSSSSGVGMQLQVTTDNGATWESGSSAYTWTHWRSESNGNTGQSSSSGDSVLSIGGFMESVDVATVEIEISRPANEDFQIIKTSVANTLDGSDVRRYSGSGAYMTDEAINGVRIRFASGDIASGMFDLLGVMG